MRDRSAAAGRQRCWRGARPAVPHPAPRAPAPRRLPAQSPLPGGRVPPAWAAPPPAPIHRPDLQGKGAPERQGGGAKCDQDQAMQRSRAGSSRRISGARKHHTRCWLTAVPPARSSAGESGIGCDSSGGSSSPFRKSAGSGAACSAAGASARKAAGSKSRPCPRSGGNEAQGCEDEGMRPGGAAARQRRQPPVMVMAVVPPGVGAAVSLTCWPPCSHSIFQGRARAKSCSAGKEEQSHEERQRFVALPAPCKAVDDAGPSEQI